MIPTPILDLDSGIKHLCCSISHLNRTGICLNVTCWSLSSSIGAKLKGSVDIKEGRLLLISAALNLIDTSHLAALALTGTYWRTAFQCLEAVQYYFFFPILQLWTWRKPYSSLFYPTLSGLVMWCPAAAFWASNELFWKSSIQLPDSSTYCMTILLPLPAPCFLSWKWSLHGGKSIFHC